MVVAVLFTFPFPFVFELFLGVRKVTRDNFCFMEIIGLDRPEAFSGLFAIAGNEWVIFSHTLLLYPLFAGCE